MSCNCPQCCLKQLSNTESCGCDAGNDGDVGDQCDCCTPNDCDAVKARFTIAWLAETPDIPCPKTCGYQLEFCEKPCCVKKIIKQLTEWLNCPPVDEEEDDDECCPPPKPKSHSPCRPPPPPPPPVCNRGCSPTRQPSPSRQTCPPPPKCPYCKKCCPPEQKNCSTCCPSRAPCGKKQCCR